MHKLSRILTEFYSTPWALRPDVLAVMQGVLQRWASGVKLSSAEIRAAIGDAPQAAQEREQRARSGPGSVAVIPVYGIIHHRIHMVEDMSGPGGTAAERVSKRLRAMVADPSVGAIVLDVDSPGGSVHGIQELAGEIREARAQKKIVTVSNAQAASAAYWFGTAAEEFVVTPSGEVGAVGVWGAHEDWSKYLEAEGVKVTLISAGKYKTEGNPYEPLSDEAREELQRGVDRYHDDFVADLAKNRGISVDDVRKGFGEGRVFGAREAVKRGMADRIETLDETVARLARSSQAQRPKARDATRLRLAELG